MQVSTVLGSSTFRPSAAVSSSVYYRKLEPGTTMGLEHRHSKWECKILTLKAKLLYQRVGFEVAVTPSGKLLEDQVLRYTLDPLYQKF